MDFASTGTDTSTVEGLLTVSGGTLKVTSGSLALSGGVSGTLTGLELGSNVALTVGGDGQLTLGAGLKLTGKSTLTLGETDAAITNQKLTLDGGFTIAGGSTDTLTLQITEAMLTGKSSGEIQLVSGWKKDYKDKISVALSGDLTGTYDNLRLNNDGKLLWGDPSFTWTGQDALTFGDATLGAGWGTDGEDVEAGCAVGRNCERDRAINHGDRGWRGRQDGEHEVVDGWEGSYYG